MQEYIQMLMPPLIQKWNQLKDEDKDLFPLLEVNKWKCILKGSYDKAKKISSFVLDVTQCVYKN